MGDFGERLRQARLQAGLSLREVSTRTKIREALLDAIEREDFARLPAGLIGRGFLRAYAREVGLDPESVIRQFRAQFEAAPTPAEPPLPNAAEDGGQVTSRDDHRGWWRFVMVAAVAAVIAVVLGYVYHRAGLAGRAHPDPSAAIGRPDVSPASLSQELKAVVDQPPREVAAASANASGADSLDVVIDASGLVWVEATADGTRVLYQLLQPGDRRLLDVREELVLRVGDAGAFRYLINGVPGRPLGRSGQIRDIRITRNNYTDFQDR